MRKLVPVLVFLIAWSPLLADDLKLDVTVAYPVLFDVSLKADAGAKLLSGIIYPLIPLVDLHYFLFDREEMLNIGFGMRALPYLLANIVVPDIALDGNFGSFSIRLQSAGGLFFIQGLYIVNAGAAPYFLPELNLFYNFNEWVSFGGGYLVFLYPGDGTPVLGLPQGMYLGLRVVM